MIQIIHIHNDKYAKSQITTTTKKTSEAGQNTRTLLIPYFHLKQCNYTEIKCNYWSYTSLSDGDIDYK